MRMEKPKRILYYDLLNIAACMAVIALHHNGLVHNFTGDLLWKQFLFAEVAFYWAVPVFLMLSGATLMNYRKKYSTAVFFRKRLTRVVFPWLFWTLFLLAWKTHSGGYVWESYTVKELINIVLNSKVEGLYWFFPVIIGIYLFMPVMSLLAKTEYKKTLWYLVGFFTAVNATIPLLCNLIGIQWNGFLNSPFNEYYMFIVLGYLLSVTDIKRKWRIPIYLTGIACACIRYAGVYTLSMRDGAKNTLFFSYGQFHSIGLAVAVFVLFKYIPWDRLIHEKGAKILSIISGCSLGIYLIHHQVMGKELNILGIEASSFAWRTAGVLLTYVVSLGIVMLVKQIPVVKKVFP